MTLSTRATTDLTALTRDAVVRVRNVACLATGTAFFTADVQLITNRNVIAASQQVQLSTWDGTDSGGVISGISTQNDLARLTASASRSSKLSLASADPAAGEEVWVAGYPNGDQLQLTQGTVTDEVNGTTFGQSGKVIRSNARSSPATRAAQSSTRKARWLVSPSPLNGRPETR